MKNIQDVWVERVVRRSSTTKDFAMTHVLVVVTDLLTDLDITDFDALDYLEGELRRVHQEVDEIRFVPRGRPPVDGPVAEVFAIRGLPVEAQPEPVAGTVLGKDP